MTNTIEEHHFPLRIPKKVWEHFVSTLPISISANEKINKLIIEYLISYDNAVGEFSAEKGNKNKDWKQ